MRFGKKSRDEDLEVVPVIGKESEQEEPSRPTSAEHLACGFCLSGSPRERRAGRDMARREAEEHGPRSAPGGVLFAGLQWLPLLPDFSGAALMLASMFFRDSAMGRRAISLTVAVLPGSYLEVFFWVDQLILKSRRRTISS